jgi:prepilin-type N-terminal cleavage/methylation domain-containing protein
MNLLTVTPNAFQLVPSVDGRVGRRPRRAGFSMIEMLVVVVIMAVVVTATIGVTGGISASRGMTGVHQMAAACDMARARAMQQQREVFLAFANPAAGDGLQGRAVLVCAAPARETGQEAFTPEDDLQQQRDSVLEPLSEWIYLPEGHYFAELPPARPEAGVNVLLMGNSLRSVRVPGGGVASLVCLGFGGLGEVVHPESAPSNGSPILIAIADRAETLFLRAQDCRWIGIQSHSGSSIILP